MSLGAYQLVAIFTRSARVLHSSFYGSYESALKEAIAHTNKNLVMHRHLNNIDELKNINYDEAAKSKAHYLYELAQATHRLNGRLVSNTSEVPFYAVIALPGQVRIDTNLSSPF